MITTNDLFLAGKAVSVMAKDEAMYRASINRLYYACYHKSYEYHVQLPQPGTVGQANGKHNQLINQLSYPSPGLTVRSKAESIAMGKLLRVICAQRVDSDYYLIKDVSEHDMKLALGTAESIFSNT